MTRILYIILSLTIGSFFLGLALNLISLTSVFVYLGKEILSDPYHKLTLGLVGAIILLFCLRYLQTVIQKLRKDKSIAFESSDGKVSITLFAVEEMLKKVLEERREVAKIKPRVLLKKNNIEVTVRGVLTSQVNLMEFTKEIQESIKEKVESLLGSDKTIIVNLEIKRVSLDGKKTAVEEKEPEIPFRNY